MNKDLTVATAVFGACLLILVIAFSEPEMPDVLDDTNNNTLAFTDDVPSTDADDDPPAFGDDYSDDADNSMGSILDDQDDDSDTEIAGADSSSSGSLEDLDLHLGGDTDVDDDNESMGVSVVEPDDNFVSAATPGDDSADDNSLSFDTADDDSETSTPNFTPGDTGSDRIHVVARGDILGSISQQYYGTTRYWRLIQETNNVYENELQPGQRLIIPGVADAAPVARPSTGASTSLDLEPGQRSYTVKRGDNYYVIARRELGDASRFKELERLNAIDAYELDVGDVIVLPETGTVRATSDPEPRAIAGAKIHVIAAGETLGDISRIHYGTTTRWKEIAAANGNLDPRRLHIGKKLQIPNADSAAGSVRVSTSTDTGSADGRTYTIQSGDTLGEIAQRELGSATKWKAIRDANPGINPKRLTVGTKIKIPGAASSNSGRVRITPSENDRVDFNIPD